MSQARIIVFSRRVVLVSDSGRAVGEDHVRAKLSNAQVDEIVAMHEAGSGYAVIAKRFGVAKSTIADIIKFRRRAKTVTGQRTVVRKVVV